MKHPRPQYLLLLKKFFHHHRERSHIESKIQLEYCYLRTSKRLFWQTPPLKVVVTPFDATPFTVRTVTVVGALSIGIYCMLRFEWIHHTLFMAKSDTYVSTSRSKEH